MPIQREAFLERFVDKVTVTESCWVWGKGTKYPLLQFDNVKYAVHRLSYLFFNGPIRKGYVVHHTCENTACVNPAHLVAVTRSEHQAIHNTHCRRGHLLEGYNIVHKSRGGRACRKCVNLSKREARRRG